ncbi:MAG: hypothetical protein CVV27_08690 [Candidatus Melainabacteria bacterium HGW-Melainabacteria-1]|nr:MAG: hypothetical protein CVV27_08690 [Candidatus Melainabacteria bacterium HGW-Melainabacteria-1]
MEDARYRQLQEQIQYCREPAELDRLVQGLLAPTGFGSNQLADTDEPIGLDYHEMADCLAETDKKYFEFEIDLLLRAHRQLELMRDGVVPDKPIPVNPWEHLM